MRTAACICRARLPAVNKFSYFCALGVFDIDAATR